MEIRHILITTDLTQEAARAYGPAYALALRLGARVTLLHAVDELLIPPGAEFAPVMDAPNLSSLMRDAEKALAQEREVAPEGLDVFSVVTSGDGTAKCVVRYAEANNVDLIALSTHGRSGWRRLALGSVAESILRESSIPVLCFPRP